MRPVQSGRRPIPRFLALAVAVALSFGLSIALALLLRPARAAASSVASAASGPQDFLLDSVRMSSDGRRFVLSIRTPAPWSHWTLGDPARIIVDLGTTRSRLPNAPGLYRVELGRGVLRSFRTSQHLNTPLDRRVRITLELSRVVAYEARRVGDEIQIVIPDDGSGKPWSQVVGASGEPDFTANLSAPTTPIAAKSKTPATEETHETHETPFKPFESADVSAPVNTPVTAPVTVPVTAPRSLREALSSVVGEERVVPTDPEKAGEAEASHEETTHALPTTHGSSVPHEEPAEPDAPPAQRWGEEHSDEEAALLEAKQREAEVAAEAERPQESSLLHETRAGNILQETAAAWVESRDLAKANAALARFFQFYGHTEVAPQAGLLRRELLVLQGEEVAADAQVVADSLPDVARISAEVYGALLHEYGESGAWLEAERIFRTWGPHYPSDAAPAGFAVRLAEALAGLGKGALAREYLLALPEGDPGEPRALLLLARMADDAGRPDEALELYRRLSMLPTSAMQQRGLVRAADLAFQRGEFATALAGYEALLAGEPPTDEEPWAMLQIANCLWLLGDPDGAKGRYETILSRWPQSYWVGFAQERLDALQWNRSLVGRVAGGAQ